MKEPVNQLEFVRKALAATPSDEWDVIASAASLSKRTLYNIVADKGSPTYKNVHALLRVFEARKSVRRGADK